jgi:anti-anti-sigma regulatory factor
MAQVSANLLVSVRDSLVLIKVAGRANFTVSVDFKRVVTELRQRGFARFLCDLSECTTMDSTFLGVLAGLAHKPVPGPTPQVVSFQLLLPNPRITEQLDNLGIAHLFEVVSDRNLPAGDLQPVEPGAASQDRAELCRTSLEAHQTLMELNPANVAQFKDVAAFLAEDLKRLERKD